MLTDKLREEIEEVFVENVSKDSEGLLEDTELLLEQTKLVEEQYGVCSSRTRTIPELETLHSIEANLDLLTDFLLQKGYGSSQCCRERVG